MNLSASCWRCHQPAAVSNNKTLTTELRCYSKALCTEMMNPLTTMQNAVLTNVAGYITESLGIPLASAQGRTQEF